MDGLTTAPRDSYEYHEYWDEQWMRCQNGYQSGDIKITGPHYFYLNFWKIRAEQEGLSGKRLMNPRFLDIDHEFFWEVERCKLSGKDLLVLKRRQAGFSYKSSALGAHEWTTVPDSLTIVASGEEKYAKNTFRFIKSGLNELADGEFYKNRVVDSMEEIMAGYKETIDGRERIQGYLSQVLRITAADPQALVGKSPSFVIYEEVGKFKGIIDTKMYTDPAMEAQGRKTGFSLLIGTGGEDNTSIDEVTDMFYKPATFGLMEYDNVWDSEVGIDDAPRRTDLKKVGFFVPGDRFTQFTDKDGNSQIPESRKMIMERREKKKGDKRAWLKEVTQFPLNPEEALMVPDGNEFNVQKLRARLGELLKHESLADIVVTGDIDWKRDENNVIIGTQFIPSVNGRFRITEHPVCNSIGQVPPKVYVASTDSYDKDKVASINGSFGSCGIFKTFWDEDPLGTSEKFVCTLTERPATADEFYEDTAKMCVHYGWAMNLIEHSNLLIGNWYSLNGFARLLKERPEVAYSTTIKNSNSQNTWGIETTTKPYWIQSLADYIENNAHKFDDIELIKALIRYRNQPDYNCDRTIMMALGIVHRNDVIHIMKKPKVLAQKFGFRYVVRSDGSMARI